MHLWLCEIREFVDLSLILSSLLFLFYVFFFKQKTAYEMRISDWSSDVCSSDLLLGGFTMPGDPAGVIFAFASLSAPHRRRALSVGLSRPTTASWHLPKAHRARP